MKRLVIFALGLSCGAALAAPPSRSLSETVTRPTYTKSAQTLHKWVVQDFTTTVRGGAALFAVERDSHAPTMCYAVTERDRMDALFFAVHVPCAAIK